MLVVGCAPSPPVSSAGPSSRPGTRPLGGSSTGSPSPAGPASVPPARQGKTAKTERIRFAPRRLELPGAAWADVVPASTVDGQLKVPENVQQVGWWDGSSYANDPYGHTVLAGHVDSTEGFGFFARLLLLEVGDVVTVTADKHRLSYKITGVQSVSRSALATDSQAFDQTGDHRLVLITCTGRYDRARGGYDQNLVVTATPVGTVR